MRFHLPSLATCLFISVGLLSDSFVSCESATHYPPPAKSYLQRLQQRDDVPTTCTFSDKAVPPKGFTCNRSGSLSSPSLIRGLSSTAENQTACRDRCLSNQPQCVSFGYNRLNSSCNLYDKQILKSGFRERPTATYFWNRHCFSRDCNVCPSGLSACNSICVDKTNDERHCGSCNAGCNALEQCVNSTCQPQQCAILGTGSQCLSASIADHSCCSGTCRDLDGDNTNCGRCGTQCRDDEICSSSTCVCPASQISCSGHCTNTNEDPQNCGACRTACRDDQVCSDGNCSCPTGQLECNGVCTDESEPCTPVCNPACDPTIKFCDDDGTCQCNYGNLIRNPSFDNGALSESGSVDWQVQGSNSQVINDADNARSTPYYLQIPNAATVQNFPGQQFFTLVQTLTLCPGAEYYLEAYIGGPCLTESACDCTISMRLASDRTNPFKEFTPSTSESLKSFTTDSIGFYTLPETANKTQTVEIATRDCNRKFIRIDNVILGRDS